MTKIKKKYLEEPEESEQKAEESEEPQEKLHRGKYKRKKFLIPKEEKVKKPVTNEERLYYYKLLLGFVSGFVGRLILGLFGWWLFLWLAIFWFGAPFILGLLIAPYQKGKWDWKMFLKTAVFAFFTIFMVTTTMIHTLIVTSPGYVPPWQIP